MLSTIWNKSKIYLHKDSYSYWKFTTEKPTDSNQELVPYQLSFRARLYDNHYNKFDKNGISIKTSVNHEDYYLYTNVISNGLAHYEEYYHTKMKSNLDMFLKVSDFICNEIKIVNGIGSLIQKNHPKFGEFNSSMILGEAMSLLSRAYKQTNDNKYKEIALSLVPNFGLFIKDGGVRFEFSEINSIWYEEYCISPVKHVLNGMIYSLIGLYDLYKFIGDAESKKYFNEGCKAVELALPKFDTGWWSYYYVPENDNDEHYISSMMYHNLHLCQLKILSDLSGNRVFLDYLKKWENYSSKITNRIRSGTKLALFKYRNK